jgi:hypothetical protein
VLSLILISMFFASSLVQSMASTGAFEIYLDGQRIFSKIESGRMPTILQIDAALRAARMEKSFPQPGF